MKAMNIDFEKGNGLVPAIIQDAATLRVLMLGYMSREAYEKTLTEGKVTFYSRKRKCLWTKGETSGNYLYVKEIKPDCDADSLLILVSPAGPVCHTGADTCFSESNREPLAFLLQLQDLIRKRKNEMPEDSYTTRLFREGLSRIARKVGEEAVELVIEALHTDDKKFREEAADLLYHLLVLLVQKDIPLEEIVEELESRHRPS